MATMSPWRECLGRTSTATAQLHAEQANHLAVMLDGEPSFQPGDALPPCPGYARCPPTNATVSESLIGAVVPLLRRFPNGSY